MPFLIRYVDNVPCLTRDVYEGCEVVERCRYLLGLGLGLKDQTEEEDLSDLSAGETTELLGFRVSSDDRGMRYDVADTALDALGDRLREAHDTDNPPVTARAVIQGWIATMGPAFANRAKTTSPTESCPPPERTGSRRPTVNTSDRRGPGTPEVERQISTTGTQQDQGQVAELTG